MKYNILIVDDEKDIRFLIKGLLEDENFEVATAKNSDEAIKSITNKNNYRVEVIKSTTFYMIEDDI